jgi:hypothetical protein
MRIKEFVLNIDSDVHKSELLVNGYTIVENVYTAEEISVFRDLLEKYFESNGVSYDGGLLQPNFFNMVEGSDIVFSNGNVSELLKEILGYQFMYCEHSDAHIDKLTGWHRDRPEKLFFRTEVGNSSLNDMNSIYKIGIYLQDHKSKRYKNKGLWAVLGSHIQPDLSIKESTHSASAINPSLGDIVLFDLQLIHKGEEASFFQKFGKKILPSRVFSYIARGLKSRSFHYRKAAIFFTFGQDSEYLKFHMEDTRARQVLQSGMGKPLPSALANVLSEQDVNVYLG